MIDHTSLASRHSPSREVLFVFRGPYVIYGIEPSYFTRQVECLFRYKTIPHKLHLKSPDVREEVEARAGTHLIPAVHTPEDWFLWDSTPIAFWTERMHPEVPILPGDPLQHMVCRVIEDWIDEWLIRPALHYRWCYEPDRTERGLAIAKNLAGVPTDGEVTEEVKGTRDAVVEWSDTACEAMSVTEEHEDEVTSSFKRFVDRVDDHLNEHSFFLGDRPCLADLALAGALKAHFATDPTPRDLLQERTPSLIEYMQRLWQGDGRDADWPEPGTVPDTLRPILEEIGGDFATYLRANRESLAEGEDVVTIDLGHGEQEMATRLYAERCRVDIADALDRLDSTDHESVDELLDAVGLSEVYAVPAAPDVERRTPRDDRR